MTASVRSKLLLPAGALPALLASAAPAFAGSGGFAPVSPQSPNAEGISRSYWFVTIFVVAVFVLVESLLLAFIVRFRRRRRSRDADGAQIHGSTRLETMWTIGPVLILVAIAVFVLAKLPGIRDVPAATAGSPNLVVKVTGRQYYWQYEYPNGVIAIDELRAPQGTTVELEVTAPVFDVIHSWWIPALGGKIDAIPGRVNRTWFAAERTGVFRGQCAELCGLNHARMLAAVEVLPKAEFETWLTTRKDAQDAGTSPLGRELYVGGCAKCHGLAGEGKVAANAPALKGSRIVTDAKAIDVLLRKGQNLMPAIGRDWSDAQMRAMTGYLKERFAGGN
ncbi:CoxB: cytochrome c oxidase, subunit II [Gaiella occulta]|uniref:Cytochrome c oxidase subunit 2 n=1 Tax=Gaiella occulta TaxID=1002870 RepID=A0A7M2Z1Z2_9ACTN|nr:CoxB: cytochrome c oxidase, subunit II [Gaiella occulta]